MNPFPRRFGIGIQFSGWRFCNVGWDLYRSLHGRYGTKHTLWINLFVIRIPIWFLDRRPVKPVQWPDGLNDN